ncbi:MAG: helix-turn-helix transcriptional regulator [Ruminococcaceae bacterium]|nr:helix-turn-helix transcriptional regulator [Oscillospiraceae bacterium]
MNSIKMVVAKNITELRQSKGMTQLELAEMLNYSDKAVSKWERGESMPDIAVLVEISRLFDVKLDYLISADHDIGLLKSSKNRSEYNRGIITSVSVLLVWFIAVLTFVIIVLLTGKIGYGWLSFIYAIPVSAIVWLVLNSLWFNRKSNYLIISLLMWSLLLSVQLSLLPFGYNVGLIYVIGIPAQIIIILWSVMKKKKSN